MSTSISTGCATPPPRRFSTRTASRRSVRREGEAQRRRRRDGLLAGTPPQHAPGAAFARGDREPAQHAVVVRPEPRERGAAFGRAQRLLVRPQLFSDAAAAHDQQAREVESRAGERRRVRQVRRRDPDDVAAAGLQTRERGQREPDLADAFAREQRPRSAPPAASRARAARRRAPESRSASPPARARSRRRARSPDGRGRRRARRSRRPA